MDRRTGPIIGTCVVVRETNAGMLLIRLTLSPEGRNWSTWLQRSRSSPLQFHSILRKDDGIFRVIDSQSEAREVLCLLYQSRFWRMKRIFQSGNRLVSSLA